MHGELTSGTSKFRPDSLGMMLVCGLETGEGSLNVSAQVKIEAVVGSGPHYNVVGKLEGSKHPDKCVIVSGHYDTVMTSGFCDNGAGTAGVIELAHVFAEANRTGMFQPKYTILFVALASEELFLVGSINYVKQHKAEMGNIVAVINLDCIGSDELYVSRTDPGVRFDLDELIREAAEDLGVDVTLIDVEGSDHDTFKNPSWADARYQWCWGLNAGIADATPSESSSLIISYPLMYSDQWNRGYPGWIHSSYDNSTSTTTLNWVEIDDLGMHVKVAALSITRIVAPNPYDVSGPTSGVPDGVVDMRDIGYVARRFMCTPSDSLWDPNADIDGNGKIDMKDIGTVARHFMEHYP